MSYLINIFSLHYFLWFSALTAVYGYVGVYAKHYANASPSQYGLLNMILPFVSILAKLFFCSLADRHRAYRAFFIWFLGIALIGFVAFVALPIFIKPQPEELGLNSETWILICIMTSLFTISMGVISCLSDAFAMNSAKKNESSYGLIRVWGTIGWGLSSILIAFINQSDKLPFLLPGLITTVVLVFIDIVAVWYWPQKDDFNLDRSNTNNSLDDVVSVLEKGTKTSNVGDKTKLNCDQRANSDYGTAENHRQVNASEVNESQAQPQGQTSDLKIQWLLFKEVSKRRLSLFRYLILFTISGSLISIQWSYLFVYLKAIYPTDFTYISGLSMVSQAFLGELPFFILSKYVVRMLGRSHTLSISFISLGCRYLLYEFLLRNSNMYYVLVTEMFQGPSFGLFYVVMTEVGLDYSTCEEAIVKVVEKGYVANNAAQIQKLRQALRATMQSLMSACYEGLGLGIGSIVGGIVIDHYGFNHLWIWSGAIAIVLGLMNLLIELLRIPILVDKSSNIAFEGRRTN